MRTWPRDRLAANPFKSGRVSSLRRIVPNGLRPDKIRIDLAHTYAICGWGKDDIASAIIFLAVHRSLFGNGVLEHKLVLAYESFVDYCKQRGKNNYYHGVLKARAEDHFAFWHSCKKYLL